MVVRMNALGLRNFKPFGDETQWAPMSNITLIYGPNSGGKSSLIQSILLLKQSEEERARAATMVPRGRYVDLGGFTAMVHKHQHNRRLGISVQMATGDHDLARTLNIDLGIMGSADLPVLTDVGYEICQRDGRQLKINLVREVGDAPPMSIAEFQWSRRGGNPGSIDSYINYASHSLVRERIYSLQRQNVVGEVNFADRRAIQHGMTDSETPEEIAVLNVTPHRALGDILAAGTVNAYSDLARPFLPSAITIKELWERHLAHIDPTDHSADIRVQRRNGDVEEHGIDFVDMVDYMLYPTQVINAISNQFRTLTAHIAYLGPLLNDPQRYYSGGGGGQPTVGSRGEYAFDIISYDESIRRETNAWLSKFGIPYVVDDPVRIDLDELAGDVNLVPLIDQRTGTRLTPADVGFGISQILPVVVEGVAGRSDIVCVDQPEVHLHPRLQAEIADLMIETRTRKQWIVETHSELLARRIQTRVAKGDLSPSEVSVLYVDPSTLGSTIEKLEIDHQGEFIDEWPAGFFADRQREIRVRRRSGR